MVGETQIDGGFNIEKYVDEREQKFQQYIGKNFGSLAAPLFFVEIDFEGDKISPANNLFQ